MTIQVKATEQYFNVLFIMLGKVALASESVDEFLTIHVECGGFDF